MRSFGVRRAAPLSSLRPAFVLAGAYGSVAIVWLLFGGTLPGGRWLAIHLFTLGVLSNLVLALTEHFAHTVLHVADPGGRRGRVGLLNLGAVLTLVGLPAAMPVVVGVGALAASAAVVGLYRALRSARHAALGARFAFVVRGYERACGAFLHGAVLGLLLGSGVLGGTWIGGARLAHLHVNLLGWGGITLLATIPFFGPTMLRRRIEDGAEHRAASALRRSSWALTLGALCLLLSGADAAWRLPAAAALAVYAAGATAICLPVLRTARRADPSLQRWAVAAACGWLLLVVWSDAVVVAFGRWALLDALGAGLVLGVLLQSILAAVCYLAPMVLGASPASRTALRQRLQRRPALVGVTLNAGVVLLVAAVIADVPTVPAGWALVIAATLVAVAPLARGVGRDIVGRTP